MPLIVLRVLARVPSAHRVVAMTGSVAIALAGEFWLVQRTFFPGR